MSIWRNVSVNHTRVTGLVVAALAGLIVAGCSSPSSSTGATPPPPTQEEVQAQVQHPVLPPTLSADQMAKLCQQAPDTCHRIQQTQPLTFADLQVLGRLGIGPDQIIDQVKHTRTIYYLTAENIIDLKKSGLTDKVIDFLVDTPNSVAHAAP